MTNKKYLMCDGINSDRPGLRSGESEVEPHLVSSLTEIAEIPVTKQAKI